jgi:pyridoxal phosphate enzyme (YggS family)
MSHDSDSLENRLSHIREQVAAAAKEAHRSDDELTLIVVTKFHPSSLIRELAALGVTDIGENRHQEAAQKFDELSELDVTWHFIGQLQTKQARQVARYADVIHGIDRVGLVDALQSIDRVIDCFIQVNLTDDIGRGGVEPDQLLELAEQVLLSPTLNLRGVMAVAPLDEPPRPAFARLRGYSELVQSLAPEATDISAGMTLDFTDAIAEGATHLRIGSAITGNRPSPG